MIKLALSAASGLAHLHMEIVGTQGEWACPIPTELPEPLLPEDAGSGPQGLGSGLSERSLASLQREQEVPLPSELLGGLLTEVWVVCPRWTGVAVGWEAAVD